MSLAAIERGIRPPSGGDFLQAERVQTEVISGRIPSLRNHLGSWKLRLAGQLGGALGLLSVACTSPVNSASPEVRPAATLAPGVGGEAVPTYPAGHQNAGLNELINRFNRGEGLTPEELNRINAAKAQEAQATAEAQKPPAPEATQKPEVKQEIDQEIDCGIVDPEYRKYAEVIDWKNPSGQILKLIGFRFPKEKDKDNNDKKVPIKTPIKGQVAYTESNPISSFRGIVAIVSDPNNINGTLFRYRGNLQSTNMLSKDVVPGEEIGFSQNGAQKVLDNYDYDLIVSAQTGSDSDEKALRAACPEAFTKSAVPIALGLPKPPATYTDIYIPKGQDLETTLANLR